MLKALGICCSNMKTNIIWINGKCNNVENSGIQESSFQTKRENANARMEREWKKTQDFCFIRCDTHVFVLNRFNENSRNKCAWGYKLAEMFKMFK